MEFILNNWYVIVGIIALLVVVGIAIYKFAGLPTKSQISKVKEWMLYAVVLAEKDLGSGTGTIKLRAVYDMFVTRFPLVAKVVSFGTFSLWVDEALKEMKVLLKENQAVDSIVETK